MELDFIPNVNEFGEHFLRLYNFGQDEAIKFRQLLIDTVLQGKTEINLGQVNYIQPRNCNLILRITQEDEGITLGTLPTFYCDLTQKAWVDMVELLDPYCERKTSGYKMLYDLDNPIDFVFAPGGVFEETEEKEDE